MEAPDNFAPSESRLRHWQRALRPLLWWFILVLVLYAIRTHLRWMERTRLQFSVSLQGRPTDARVMFDGQPAFSGQKIKLGKRSFVVTHPKAKTFSTNLFIWYGGKDFGQIELERAVGKLSVEADPPAKTLTIRGPEFTLTLNNSSGTNLLIPTDEYTIAAEYIYKEERKTSVVSENFPSTVLIAPQFGVVKLDSVPSGATVYSESGTKLGTTPLNLKQFPAGLSKFTLERQDYASTVASFWVGANTTNQFQTILVNRYYAAAMQAARDYFSNRRYAAAAESASEALKYKADDPEAASLQREATALNNLAQARMNGERGDYKSAMADVNKALPFLSDDTEAKQLLAQYKKLEVDRIEVENKRAAESAEKQQQQREAELAEARVNGKKRELRQLFNTLVRGFANSGQFADHELSSASPAETIGPMIKQELANGEPAFQIVRFEQSRSDLFALQARQTMGLLGYRDCFVVGENVREGETQILFKVVEYDHPPTLNILGNVLTATIRQTDTDGSVAARFQEQIRQGAPLVEARIRQAISLAARAKFN